MNLFPAYGGASSSSSQPSTDTRIKPFDATAVTEASSNKQKESALDWLKSDSYLEQLASYPVTVISSSSESSDSDVEEIVNLDSSSASEDLGETAVKIVKVEEKQSVKLKSAPIGSMFLEDLSLSVYRPDEEKPDPFRLDRTQNPALRKYKSVFAGHVSKYSTISPQFAMSTSASKPLQYRIRERLLTSVAKKKDKRYFDRSQIKKILKFQDVDSGRVKCSPISMKDPPLVLKLTKKPDFLEGRVANASESMDLPYDELKKVSIRQKIEEFNKKLNNEPHNIQLWMEFVEFQGDVAKHGYSTSALLVESALLEKKLAIYDRALERNPGNIRLLVEKIKLKSNSANQDTIAEEWKNIAFVHPNNAEVWWEYIMAQCRKFSVFNIDRMLFTFSKCLSTLSDIADGTIKSHAALPNMEEQMIYLFMALVYILREAGFTERSVVLLQCQIEFCMFPPQNITKMLRPKAIDELEVYFSSSSPLFGQHGAVGWKSWRPGLSVESSSLPNLEMEDEIDQLVVERAPKNSTRAQIWSFIEESRSARRVAPISADAPPSDDPERQVLFDDVSRFLTKIQAPENRYRLLLCYFEYFGVDVSLICGTLDTFLKVDSGFASSFNYRSAVFDLLTSNESDSIRPKVINYDSNVFKSYVSEAFQQAVKILPEPFRTHLVCVYVKHELGVCANIDLSTATSKIRVKQLKTQIRNILKEPANRNNLAVWALCSECELRFGSNINEAIRMAETAISMSHQLKLYSSWGALCHLATQTAYYCFKFNCTDLTSIAASFETSRIADVEVDQADKAGNMIYLLASCLLRRPIPKSERSGVEKLKLEVEDLISPFLQINTPAISDNQPEPQLMPVQPLICQLAECYALFTYLMHRISNDPSRNLSALTSADSVFTSVLNQADRILSTKSNPFTAVRRFIEQVLLQVHANRIILGLFDYKTNIKSISHLKEIVLTALNDFPSNSVFIRCLIAIREPAFLSSSFVKFTRSMSHRIHNPLAWFTIINGLLSKFGNQSIGGADNLIRQFFDKALNLQYNNHVSTRSSILWAFYIAYEVRQATGSGNKRVESVLYRALQSCPWAKEIYMALARNQKDDDDTYRRLNDSVDMIVEKGLRLHTLVDELATFPSLFRE